MPHRCQVMSGFISRNSSHLSRSIRRASAMTSTPISVKPLASIDPEPKTAKAHHVGSPPTSFKNPWSSYKPISLGNAFQAKFGSHPEKKFVPIPGPEKDGSRSRELVRVRKPTWSEDRKDSLRATWIGHASFLVETPALNGADRGVRILFDPVFSERTSPSSYFGPKRYTPTPCTIEDLPEIDLVVISHNHYDHLDIHTVGELHRLRKQNIHFFTGLNHRAWFEQNVCPPSQISELDWWDTCNVELDHLGSLRLTCLPCQHGSRRSGLDGDHGLWCSWALEAGGKKLYFAGDTAYQAVGTPSPCPVF